MSGHKKVQSIVVFTALFTLTCTAYDQESKYETTDAGTEYHLMGTLGTSYHLTPNWSASFAARLEHHFMDVLVTDRVTGASGKVDSQSPVGAYLSINYQFD